MKKQDFIKQLTEHLFKGQREQAIDLMQKKFKWERKTAEEAFDYQDTRGNEEVSNYRAKILYTWFKL